MAQEMRPEQIYQHLLPSVVTLQVEDQAGARYVGTGFLALSNTIAVTAWHVVADARKVTPDLPMTNSLTCSASWTRTRSTIWL